MQFFYLRIQKNNLFIYQPCKNNCEIRNGCIIIGVLIISTLLKPNRNSQLCRVCWRRHKRNCDCSYCINSIELSTATAYTYLLLLFISYGVWRDLKKINKYIYNTTLKDILKWIPHIFYQLALSMRLEKCTQLSFYFKIHMSI